MADSQTATSAPEFKSAHFIGIGGAGMSAIAYVLIKRGYDVSGSDLNAGHMSAHLAEEGAMVYTCTVCRREKTEKIDKLVAEKEYTITFDSKGGSAVQPVKASAGAAITAPADPPKDGFVFVCRLV